MQTYTHTHTDAHTHTKLCNVTQIHANTMQSFKTASAASASVHVFVDRGRDMCPRPAWGLKAAQSLSASTAHQ